MLDDIVLDPWLAFVLLSALLIGAAIPLAIAWAKLLPEEEPPFSSFRALETDGSAKANPVGRSDSTRDPFAVVLLIFVTLSYISQFPGVPYDFLLLRTSAFIHEPWFQGALLFCHGFFIAIPVIAAWYSLFRRHAIRLPLIFAGILVPLLWLAVPWLRRAFLSP